MDRKRHTHFGQHHHHHHHHHHRRDEWIPDEGPSEGHGTAVWNFEPATATLEKRIAVTTACGPDDNSPRCEKPTAASNTMLPIILGSAIPIVLALVVLLWLHRRHLQKLKLEELNDKTKSMDFGMGFGAAKKGGPEKPGKTRQLSMDLDLNNPYILPGTLRGSRESLRSLGKDLDAGDPRYGLRPGTSHSRPGTSHSQGGLAIGMKQNYAPSQHSNLAHSATRESSLYTASVRGEDDSPNGSTMSMSAELLSGAQKMAMSTPPPPRATSLSQPKPTVPDIKMPSPPQAVVRPGLPPALQPGNGTFEQRDSYASSDEGDLRHSHQHLASHIVVDPKPASPTAVNHGPTIAVTEAPKEAQGPQFGKSEVRPPSDGSHYGDDGNLNSIQFRFSTASEDNMPQEVPKPRSRDTLAPGPHDNRRLSMGFRPLPPDGNPDENAEERALRIRSFYKEYFDESNADQRASYVEPAQSAYYEEDIPQQYMVPTPQDDSAAVYDPSSDRYMIPGARPFAEPPARRAMTPPPRMPRQFQAPRTPSASGGRFMPPAPRSFSAQSGRFMPPGARGPAPRKPFIPPSPLQNLPTPSQLSENAFASPLGFAPPPKIGDVASGRNSPAFKGERPYSPAVSPHIPLVSAFDELSVLAAPHALRKSGTYTALDFAPPKKFKNDDTMSDAGSIRSNRSGAHALQVQHNIRAGAYRVSRIPQDVVPCKDDMAAQLKPTMDLSQRY